MILRRFVLHVAQAFPQSSVFGDLQDSTRRPLLNGDCGRVTANSDLCNPFASQGAARLASRDLAPVKFPHPATRPQPVRSWRRNRNLPRNLTVRKHAGRIASVGSRAILNRSESAKWKFRLHGTRIRGDGFSKMDGVRCPGLHGNLHLLGATEVSFALGRMGSDNPEPHCGAGAYRSPLLPE